MRGRHLRHWIVLAAVAAGLVLPTAAQPPRTAPSPEDFFGFPMGADRQLAHWDDMVRYYELLANVSDRVVVEELGKTTLGHPYLLVTVSSPDTIRDLPRFKAMQRQLADPRHTTEAEAEKIARDGKAVVLVGANVHATEIGTSQTMNDIIYQLATEDSPWIEHVLSNTIVLLIPSQNPDGQRMVVDWYRQNVGTPYEGSPLPELYHKYAGHDNNRDSYMLTQVETQHLNRVLYKEWLPEVYLDAHQMGNRSARIFVPPFENPPNPNVDPLVWSQVNLFGQAMAAKLHESDRPGVIWGELYSGYWQGANNTNPWWHNIVGLLTEVASANLASPVLQEHVPRASNRAPAPSRLAPQPRSGTPLAAPTDTQARMNYPNPWLGGAWSFADVVDYSRLATQGLLESVANHRVSVKRNFHLMNRRAIERFETGRPFAFVIPAQQHDPAALTKLIQLLQAEAAEIHIADAPFVAGAETFDAGTIVVRLDQSFGRWVKDILEPQRYPDIRWPNAGAPFDTPYDITAWSLGMLMGVDTIQIEEPFDALLTPLAPDAVRDVVSIGRVISWPDGPALDDDATVYLLSHESNDSFVALNRLLAAGAEVLWAREPFGTAGGEYPRGTMIVRGATPELVERIAADLRLEFVATRSTDDIAALTIALPHLAVYEPWGGNIDAGWTRWVLDQHGFAYTQIRNADIQTPGLNDRFDVIVLPEMGTADLLRGLQARNVRPEYRGGIGVEGIRNLRQFVTRGGTVITLGNSAAFAVEHLSAPVTNVVRDETRDTFYAPGTILRAMVDTTHPIGYGMPSEVDVMFVNNGAFRPSRRRSSTAPSHTVVRYPNASLLRSGWIIGENKLRGMGAVIEAPLGDGRVIMHTFRVQHRGQTWATFKLLFNSIFYGPAARDSSMTPTTLDAADQP